MAGSGPVATPTAQAMYDDTATQDRRNHSRRSVIWSARIVVGDYEFDCGLVNISLSGARLRLGLPLKRGAEVTLVIASIWRIPARVAWSADSHVGIRFRATPEEVRLRLGEEAAERLGLDRRVPAG